MVHEFLEPLDAVELLEYRLAFRDRLHREDWRLMSYGATFVRNGIAPKTKTEGFQPDYLIPKTTEQTQAQLESNLTAAFGPPQRQD